MVRPDDEPDRARFAHELDRNFSVVASAGSGKTTAITQRVLSIARLPSAAEILPHLVVVTIVAHWPQGFWAGGGKVGWEFPVPLAAGGLAIALTGNGAWSLDRLLGLVYPDWLLPAWLVLVAVGVVLAIGVRSMQAPKAARS